MSNGFKYYSRPSHKSCPCVVVQFPTHKSTFSLTYESLVVTLYEKGRLLSPWTSYKLVFVLLLCLNATHSIHMSLVVS